MVDLQPYCQRRGILRGLAHDLPQRDLRRSRRASVEPPQHPVDDLALSLPELRRGAEVYHSPGNAVFLPNSKPMIPVYGQGFGANEAETRREVRSQLFEGEQSRQLGGQRGPRLL